MATVLMRMGLRSAFVGKGLFERTLAPAACTSFHGCGAGHPESGASRVYRPKIQCTAMREMSSKRNVHQTRTATSLDEDRKKDDDSDSDSDSDDEKISRTQSTFWRRKMRTLHSHLDVNKDGVLSYDDFMLLGDRFAKLGHLTDRQKEEFQSVLRQTWEEQWGEINQYNLVDVEKYLEAMHHVLEDKSLRRKVHNFLPYLFKAVDKDKSGEISVQEFKLFFQCLGLHNDDAVVSFTYIDTNEDGKISLKEFVKLGRDFFLTQNLSKPSKHFWGPLVD
ncbi:sarcoplasmic calcium-binding protein [Copidosoma floridanum]|uniref:sarcoplasmic calcium-binding protein n=1 Tax=Copidosoma floridanum TaxID=29053 RepID=UPI0006C99131|nr:sarcoplasmic calcium-binding protein [Copidosoma floridanum]